MNMKAVAIELPSLGELIDTLENQPKEIQDHLRELRRLRAAKHPMREEPAKSHVTAVLTYYIDFALSEAGVDAIVESSVPGHSISEMLANITNFPADIRARLQALVDAGANPDLEWHELSDAAKAAVKEHGPALHKYWTAQRAPHQPPTTGPNDTTSFSA